MSNSRPKVSIIVPVHNTQKYLAQCIKSILDQTYTNLQIVLVDDGSTDDSLLICKHFAEKDERIDLIHQKNCGVSKTRNKAINIAKGQYSVFVDSDDKIKSNFIEKLTKTALSTNSDITICGYQIRTRHKTKKIEPNYLPSNGADFCDAMICKKGIKGYCWNKLYRTDIIKNNHILFNPDLDLAEDMHFNVQYAKFIKKISIIKEPLYIYRQRNNSATRKNNSSQNLEKLKKTVEEIKRITIGHEKLLEYILFNARIEQKKKLTKENKVTYREYIKNNYVPLQQRIRIIIKYKLRHFYKMYKTIKNHLLGS